MQNVSLSLLVLKTQQLEKLRAFYSTVGIEFCEEQHGDGPTHFAGKVGGAILEIYPLPEGGQVDSSTRIGFFVEDIGFVLESLWRNEFCELKKVKQTQWGYRAVVRDPDGRAVELCQ
jgi:lactoylglutathione lyase